jgi:hypothetical protein
VETVAIIAAILAAADDLARTQAQIPTSEEPTRFIDDAEKIYAEAKERESRKRYPG